jgi:hypothetical protein
MITENSEKSYQSELDEHTDIFDNSIKSRKNVKTFITKDKFIDTFDDGTQEERIYWRTNEERHYQTQLKNYEDTEYIKLYENCELPDEFLTKIDANGDIITKEKESSKIMTIANKILSLAYFK